MSWSGPSRLATRYDKHALTYRAAVLLSAVIAPGLVALADGPLVCVADSSAVASWTSVQVA